MFAFVQVSVPSGGSATVTLYGRFGLLYICGFTAPPVPVVVHVVVADVVVVVVVEVTVVVIVAVVVVVVAVLIVAVVVVVVGSIEGRTVI